MSPIDALMAELEQELASTRKLLEAVPAEHLAQKPADKSMSTGDLAMHIATIAFWGYHTLKSDEIDVNAFPNPGSPAKPEDFLGPFEEGARMFREALASTSADDLGTPWTLRAGEQVFFTMPRGVVLRSFVFNHLYHHRGQMTVHLRLVGAKVPGMYGPSADEMPMPS